MHDTRRLDLVLLERLPFLASDIRGAAHPVVSQDDLSRFDRSRRHLNPGPRGIRKGMPDQKGVTQEDVPSGTVPIVIFEAFL